MTAEVFRLTLGVKVKGVAVAAASPDHRFLVVGTVHGWLQALSSFCLLIDDGSKPAVTITVLPSAGTVRPRRAFS